MSDTLLSELDRHYRDAKDVLERQVPDFNKRVDLFRGHIDSAKWPYRSRVFDPRIYTVITNKTSRLFAQPPRGKVHPREGSDVASANIVNELLNFQWDEANHYNGSMLEKWMLMDQWTRIYGSAFALTKWMKKGDFDGPEFQVLRNVDCLPDPRATSIEDANWFQVVEYTTLEDLENTSDVKGKSTYKNLGELRKKIKDGVDQGRGTEFRSRNLEIWGIDDTMLKDPAFRRIQIVTEYRKDKWITFSPDFHIILREIANPYKHGKIPVVMLRYYPLGDSLYGLSEIEPIQGIQRAINALDNHYFDTANMNLYKIMYVNPAEVRMHTLKWEPGAMWHMDRPSESIREMGNYDAGLSTFQTTYSMLVASLNNAVGEQSVGTSNLGVFNPEKTATEIADIASVRNARDVNNALFLAEALKRSTMMWIDMDKEFLEYPKIVRIVGKQAIERVRESQFSDFGAGEFSMETPEPRFQEIVPGEIAEVKIFEDDLKGGFDYVPDVQSMSLPNREQITELRRGALEFLLNPMVQQQMMMNGVAPDIVMLITDLLEDSGLKDARKYFDKASMPMGGPPQEGGVAPEGGMAPEGGLPTDGSLAPEGGLPVPGTEGSPESSGKGILGRLLGMIKGA